MRRPIMERTIIIDVHARHVLYRAVTVIYRKGDRHTSYPTTSPLNHDNRTTLRTYVGEIRRRP